MWSEPEDSNKFLRWLTKKGRRRIINDPMNGRPYMFRYYIANKNRADDDPANPIFNLFYHKIVQNDPRHLHDHPWWYLTVILKGGYYEITPKGEKWHGPGSVLFRKAKSLHRLVLKDNQPCHTLFFRFKRLRDWGFIVNNMWIAHKLYFSGRYYLRD